MSLSFLRCSELSSHQREALDANLGRFYRNPPPEYYKIADTCAGRYSADELPFHHDLVQRVSTGMSILEVGCGTAHLCREIEARGGNYTGIDYSEQLLAENKTRYPNASFFKVGTRIDLQFDLVVSLYAIEHVVDPPSYLDCLLNFCKPGGLIGIICPEFVSSPSFPPSVYYGRSPRRLREKARCFAAADILSHIIDLKVLGPRWKRTIELSEPGSFWINLKPAVLNGGSYVIDADAVHMAGLRDLLWYFNQKDARPVITSEAMRDVPREIALYNAYCLVRKASH